VGNPNHGIVGFDADKQDLAYLVGADAEWRGRCGLGHHRSRLIAKLKGTVGKLTCNLSGARHR